jgi:glycerol-3-phosphate acyltransferase PlsX
LQAHVRVALDLMGGDNAPAAVVDGALLAVSTESDLDVVLVGPVALAERLLEERGALGRVQLVDATQVVAMDEDPARAVRTKKDAGVRVAHRLVRDGDCHAAVSVGSTGATLASAVLTLGRLTRRPALAVIVPGIAGPVVLLDVGATMDCTAQQLVQHALLGAAYAVALGLDSPRVGLLNVGEESGKGDKLRKDAFGALLAAPLRFVGNVEGHDVSGGGKADVIVTDGFTGNVLLKGIEGANTRAGGGPLPASAILLGVGGVSVVGHGSASAEDVAACVRSATSAVRDGVMARTMTALDEQRAKAASS